MHSSSKYFRSSFRISCRSFIKSYTTKALKFTWISKWKCWKNSRRKSKNIFLEFLQRFQAKFWKKIPEGIFDGINWRFSEGILEQYKFLTEFPSFLKKSVDEIQEQFLEKTEFCESSGINSKGNSSCNSCNNSWRNSWRHPWRISWRNFRRRPWRNSMIGSWKRIKISSGRVFRNSCDS